MYNIELSRIWHSIADPGSRKHKDYGCIIKNINNYKQACIYLSKYIAKLPENTDDIIEGRHWGNSYHLPFKVVRKIEYYDFQAKYIIELIRNWLLKNGKVLQANDLYLNYYTEQTIFMTPKDFQDIENSSLKTGQTLPP